MLAACGLLVACEKPLAKPEEPPFKTTASLQDLMKAVVDPAADALWESVGTVSTVAGVEERQPRTEEDWQLVRQHAVQLVESANLLLIPGREVTMPGRQVDDAHVPGVLDSAAVKQRIDADRAGYVARIEGFREAAAKALQSVDAKSVQSLLDAGGQLQEACEACHVRFWYPQAQAPR